MNPIKEKLSAVNGLDYGKIEKMTDNEFLVYYETLLNFIDEFPSWESELKQYLAAKHYEAFSRTLLAVYNVFLKLGAAGFSQSCLRLMEELGSQKFNIVEAHLTYLLAEISGLSIDIQMTLHQGEALSKMNATAAVSAPERQRNEDGVVIKNILAVDDVSVLLTGLKSILKGTEYKVTGVTSGDDALAYVSKHRPDLFILDIEMPVMDGYELAVRLRQRGQTAPIIFLTGNATKKHVQKAMSLGAAGFIVKPVIKDQVIEKIRSVMGDS